MSRAWFCLRTQSKHEHIAAAHLSQEPEVEVYLPRIRFKRSTRQGPAWFTEALFPNYLFARFDWKTRFDTVRHTFGVSSVVHFGAYWPTLSEQVISDLQEAIPGDEPRLMDESLAAGDEIEITGGAFDGLTAIVTRFYPARQRVAVLLEFLGRKTLVELDRAAVATDKAWCAVRLGRTFSTGSIAGG